MRSLNDVVSENAAAAFARWKKQGEKRGLRRTQADLARSMSALMDKSGGEARDPESVYRQLSALLRGQRTWRLDYLEAFARSIGVTPDMLVRP